MSVAVTRSHLLALLLSFMASAATFGTVVPIGGHASDIALDERRGVLYVANFTANEIEVISLKTNAIERSINVAKQPSALAVSPDGRWLVITHYGAADGDAPGYNAVTVINLEENSRREFALSAPPLGVAFGADDRAFIVTTKDFLRMDAVTGNPQTISSIKSAVTKALPVELATFPPDITQATVTASRDGRFIYGVAEKILFHYNVLSQSFQMYGFTANPLLGPRTLSVSSDGGYYSVGWWIIDPSGYIKASFVKPSGEFETGSHVIDSTAGLIYAQIPEEKASGVTKPVLQIVAADNLQVYERIQIPENMAGHAVLNAARDTVYSVSDSGVMVLPVGRLNAAPRVRAEQNRLTFRNNGCSRQLQTQDVAIVDPGGNHTPFALEPKSAGVRLSATSGITPAVVQVTVDPSAFTARGTGVTDVEIRSGAAVNVIEAIHVHVNSREPDQRGTMISIPGKLVDLAADPVRDRLYVLRQDTNEVLVLENGTYRQVAALRTGTTPMQMAVTMDGRYLLVANDNSQMASVFDLTTMQAERPVVFPAGHFPRSVAVSGKAILAVSRVTGGSAPAMIDRIDLGARIATTPTSLGVYKNSVHLDSVLTASPNGSNVLIAMPDGNVMLYDANKDTFTASRKDFDSLSGAYAASNLGFFAVDNKLLNASLVPVGTLAQNGSSSGMFFTDQTGFWTSGASSAPGVIARLDMNRGAGMLPTSMTESALLPEKGKFIRSLAALSNRSAIVSLSTTGLTVLPWNYDAAFAPPRIERVVSAADRSDALAPGGLITILGSNLSPFDVSTADPTTADALPEACLTVNGATAPIIFASSTRVNAQLPFNAGGSTTLILRTPGGSSDSFRLQISPTAPTVFRNGTAGPDTNIPAVIRAANNDLVTPSNPIHPGDEIVIYATGLGRTNPEIPAGMPAPYEPLARAVDSPQVKLGPVDLNVFYAGLTPGLVGVYQINALVPRNVPTGFEIPLRVGQESQTTTFNVRVVR